LLDAAATVAACVALGGSAEGMVAGTQMTTLEKLSHWRKPSTGESAALV
jgi:hypothetical protein